MNKPELVITRLTELVKSQNTKARFKFTYDVLNQNDIQVDVLRKKSMIIIDDVTQLLYGTGFNRLFITIGDNTQLMIMSNKYPYVVRTGLKCKIKSLYRSTVNAIYMELGESCELVFSGPHDIKNNKNCKISHISKVKHE